MLISIPFLFSVHADPNDYGRYTGQYFQEALHEIGFKDENMMKQGRYYCVLANVLKVRLNEMQSEGGFGTLLKGEFLILFLSEFLNKAFVWGAGHLCKDSLIVGYTTGFGIVCKK